MAQYKTKSTYDPEICVARSLNGCGDYHFRINRETVSLVRRNRKTGEKITIPLDDGLDHVVDNDSLVQRINEMEDLSVDPSLIKRWLDRLYSKKE